MYIQVEGHPNLVRDSSTGAIINKDKISSRRISSEFHSMKHDINTLKEELSEIKQLLREIVRDASN